MKQQELIKVFLIALQAKYRNQYFKQGQKPEMTSPTTFKSKFIQRLWDGYQLCYDNFFKDEQVAVNLQPSSHPSKQLATTELVLSNDAKPSSPAVRPLNPNELSTVIVNSTVSIIYQNKKDPNDRWIFNSAFMSLIDAIELLYDMNIKRMISLNKWEPYTLQDKQHFLVQKAETDGRKTHIWGGTDTLCKGWSKQAMKREKYRLADQVRLGKTEICSNCIANISPNLMKAHLRFGNKNLLLEIKPK